MSFSPSLSKPATTGRSTGNKTPVVSQLPTGKGNIHVVTILAGVMLILYFRDTLHTISFTVLAEAIFIWTHIWPSYMMSLWEVWTSTEQFALNCSSKCVTVRIQYGCEAAILNFIRNMMIVTYILLIWYPILLYNIIHIGAFISEIQVAWITTLI